MRRLRLFGAQALCALSPKVREEKGASSKPDEREYTYLNNPSLSRLPPDSEGAGAYRLYQAFIFHVGEYPGLSIPYIFKDSYLLTCLSRLPLSTIYFTRTPCVTTLQPPLCFLCLFLPPKSVPRLFLSLYNRDEVLGEVRPRNVAVDRIVG